MRRKLSQSMDHLHRKSHGQGSLPASPAMPQDKCLRNCHSRIAERCLWSQDSSLIASFGPAGVRNHRICHTSSIDSYLLFHKRVYEPEMTGLSNSVFTCGVHFNRDALLK